MKNYKVQRILIDPESSSEILYFDYFKKLGIEEEELEEANTLHVGFSSLPVYPKGKVTFKVRVKDAYMLANFIVIDAPSPYNAIMGWI